MPQLLPGRLILHGELNICSTDMSYWSFTVCLCYIPLGIYAGRGVKCLNKSEFELQGLGEPDEEAGADVGAAVGGVVASVVAVVIIVIVTMWYLRKRRNNKDEKSAKQQDHETQRKPHNISQSHYQEIDDSQIRGLSNNHDYATVEGMPATPNTHAYLTIEPITGSNAQQNPDTISKEDDYDHIGDKPSDLSSNYDTTASVAQSVGSRAHSREDDYGYNRLQETPCTKTVQNDYDTTTTAGKAAQLGRNDDKTPSSPYDTAGKMGDGFGDYAVAGPMR
ncbi:uncharacterized protein LOC124265729 isoform X2 [Haliotis rubra]|uniref:uncharacterized protein LOC124265729 isoform X2 n=1 Tax=Haliotis rubra TaxID=36100 RepID=UPI001EE6037F|nr:uncharacterized protein LOC124265729 isoform X2 [Haliotis rubra]